MESAPESAKAQPQRSDRVEPKQILWVLIYTACLCFAGVSEFDHPTVLKGIFIAVFLLGIASTLHPKGLTWLVFGNREAIEITDRNLQQRILTRYFAEIRALEALDFKLYFFAGEAYSLAHLVLIFPILVVLVMIAKNVVLTLYGGTRYMACSPVLISKTGTACAQTIGMGIAFHTAFQDGTLLETTNYGDGFNRGNHMRRAYKDASILKTWEEHRQSIVTQTEARNLPQINLPPQKFMELFQ